MNKRLTSLILAVVMLLSLTVTAVPTFAAGTDNGLSLSKETASAGETFELYLKIPPITAGKSASNEFKIDFDKAVVAVTEWDPGENIPGTVSKTFNTPAEANNAGKIVVNYTVAGDGENLADWSAGKTYTCKFKVLDGATLGNTKFEITTYTIVGYEEDGYTEIDYTPAGVVKEAFLSITAAPKPAAGISLNKSTLELTVGGSETLVATVEPNDTTDTVTWTSSATGVATVDTNGKVTAVATGTATITATAGSQSATCVVTVENAPCAHTNKTNVAAKSSTCKVQGWDAYSQCNDCEQLFDKDGNAISAIPYLPLADHTPVQTATAEYLESAATCTSPAVYYEHCSVCDVKLSTTFTSGSTVPHTESGWKNDPNGHWKVCTVCGTITTTKTTHTPDREAATETDAVKCSVCGYVITPALGHTHEVDTTKFESDETNHWNTCSGCSEKQNISAHEFEWKIDKDATATEKGSKHEECKVCGYKKAAVEIPATGGSVVIIPDTDETDKSDLENPGTGAAVSGSGIGYACAALAAVGAIYVGAKKLAKKDEE